MNSNKYNFYKSSLYFLIANAVILLAGIVLFIVLGFNHSTTIAGSHIFFGSVFSVLITLALVFLYTSLRYDNAKALSIVFVAVHNALLSTAILLVIRIPITESLVMGYALLVGLSSVYTLILTEKLKDVNLKKVEFNDIIISSVKDGIKPIVILSAILVAVLLLSLLVASESMFSLARILFVMIAVVLYGAFTVAMPIWCFFSSKIKKIKKAKVDDNVENQRVVKAVTLENGEEVGSAKIEEPQSQNE